MFVWQFSRGVGVSVFQGAPCRVRLGPYDLDSVSFRDCSLEVDFGVATAFPVRMTYKRQGCER